MPDLIRHMESVARELLGDPNPHLSKPAELRYGSRGSLAVDLKKGVWHDHEAGEGGGVLDLLRRETGLTNGAAFDWLRARGVGDETATRTARRIVETYPYYDRNGALAYEVVRFEPKDFRPRTRDPSSRDGWRWKLRGTERLPYRLPELLEAPGGALVFVCEGEKDANRVASLGLLSTTNDGGAGKWRGEFADALKHSRVVMLAHNDDAGEKHAAAVISSCRKRGIPAAVLRLEGLPPKGDVSDWLDAGGTPDELLRLAEAALSAPQDDSAPEDAEPPQLRATPFTLRASVSLAPRGWLFDKRLIRRYLALTVAPGGLGKSSLVNAEVLAMVTGKPLLGSRPTRPLRVWLWNGEDDRDEAERRITAAAMHYGIRAADIGDRLFLDSGRDRPLMLVAQGRDGPIVARDQVEALIAELRAREIDVLIIDPLVTTHSVPENDNTGINAVVALWREIADRAGCAVELVHHAQKAAIANGAELGIAQSRGASALIDGVRSARFLVAMTDDQAAKAGLDSPRGMFRVETGKANLAPKPDKATWIRMVSVALGNGSGLWPEGDHVGVAERWQWPDAFDGVTLRELAEVQARLSGGDWRESEQSPEWAGHLVAEVLGLDVGEFKGRSREQTAARAKVKSIISQWRASGALRVEQRHSPRDGRDVPFIIAGEPANAA